MAAILGQTAEIAWQIVAADHVQHSVDAIAIRKPLHRLDEIVGPCS